MIKKMKPLPLIKQKGEVVEFDYKNPASVEKYVSERRRIMPRSRTGLTAKEQNLLSKSVKRARMLALLPFAN